MTGVSMSHPPNFHQACICTTSGAECSWSWIKVRSSSHRCNLLREYIQTELAFAQNMNKGITLKRAALCLRLLCVKTNPKAKRLISLTHCLHVNGEGYCYGDFQLWRG